MSYSQRIFHKLNPGTSAPRPVNRRKLSPTVERFESREMLNGAWAGGLLTGTVFSDVNGNATLSANDAYLCGATVQLYKAGCNTPISQQVTGGNGQYSFSGLSAGNYLLKEIPPCGYSNGGTQVLSQLNPATSAAPDEIAVTVTNPSSVYLNYNGVIANEYANLNDTVNGVATQNAAGPFSASLGSTAGATDIDSNFTTFCVDNTTSVNFAGGLSFQVAPQPITALTNGNSCGTISTDHAGRIAYLFNHYGNSSLTNVQGAGLQLAIWELLYDSGNSANFSSGNFKAGAPIAPTDSTTLSAVLAQAQSYYNESCGKSETADFLNATVYNCGGNGYQSMLAQNSLNFADVKGGCNPATLQNVHYVLNGCQTVSNLRGNTHSGEYVQVVFTVPAGQTDTLSLVSYCAPQTYFDANTASQQTVYQADTQTFCAGTHSLSVWIPKGDYQIDFVCGTVITHLGATGTCDFYTPQGRLISADNGGQTS